MGIFGRGLSKIFKLKPKEDTSVSEDEIKAMINNGVKAGTINEKEQELISAIFTFDNLNVKDIMTPRVNVFMLDINTPISKFKKWQHLCKPKIYMFIVNQIHKKIKQ